MPDTPARQMSPGERAALKQLVKSEYAQLKRELALRSSHLQDEAEARVRASHSEKIQQGKALSAKAGKLCEKFRTDMQALVGEARKSGFGHNGGDVSLYWLSNPPREFTPSGLSKDIERARHAVQRQAAAAEVALGRKEQEANRELIVGAITSAEASQLLDRLVPKVEVLLPSLARRALSA